MKRKRFLLGEDPDCSDPHPDPALGMHRLNPYRERRPDFALLADQYPQLLGGFVRPAGPSGSGFSGSSRCSGVTLDWTDPASQRALTAALLRHDFGVQVFEVPSDRLCPPVPNRVNYVCWVQELIAPSTATTSNDSAPETNCSSSSRDHASDDSDDRSSCCNVPYVLDIGVGAGCIYPLLGHKLFGWRCLGSDVDSSSVESSQRIVSGNNLSAHIEVVCVQPVPDLQELLLQKLNEVDTGGGDSNAGSCDVTPQLTRLLGDSSATPDNGKGPLIRSMEASSRLEFESCLSSDRDNVAVLMDACMTNPPFYDLDEEVESNAHASCTGSRLEMHTLGGEVAFVMAIILDSLMLRKRVRWYSTMLGKKQSLKKLLRILRREGVTNVHSTRFIQGKATVRWGLAWSFWEPNTATVSKVFGAKKKSAAESVVMKELKEMSVKKMLETARVNELCDASCDTWVYFIGRSGCTLQNLQVDVTAVERFMRIKEVKSSDTDCNMLDACRLLDENVVSLSSESSTSRLMSIALLRLCLNRIVFLLDALRCGADTFKFVVDMGHIDALSDCCFLVPLTTSSDSEMPNYVIQLIVLPDMAEVRASLSADANGQTLSPGDRLVAFKGLCTECLLYNVVKTIHNIMIY